MRRFLPAMLVALLLLTALAGCSAVEQPPASPSPAEPPPVSSEPSPSAQPSPSPAEPSAALPADTPSPDPAPTETPDTGYSFGMPVEESEPVEEEWFADAVFFGDSRTEGLQLFSGLRTGDFLWSKGMNVFKAVDPEKKPLTIDGVELSMLEALALKEYGKVYIMIGINELGYSTASYEEGLSVLIDRIKEIQPKAVIYLQTLPPVNETVALAKGLGSYITNAKVNSFNEAICRVAWEKGLALLDVASIYRTEAGDLAADMAVDGVHFRRQGYAQWYEYLKSHTLDPADYENGVTGEGPYVPVVPEPPAPSLPPEPSPSESPAPSESTAPTETPQPSGPPVSTEDPAPSETPAPSESPTPSETPAPSEAPAPTETVTPGPEDTTPPAELPPESQAPAESVPPGEEPDPSPAPSQPPAPAGAP